MCGGGGRKLCKSLSLLASATLAVDPEQLPPAVEDLCVKILFSELNKLCILC